MPIIAIRRTKRIPNGLWKSILIVCSSRGISSAGLAIHNDIAATKLMKAVIANAILTFVERVIHLPSSVQSPAIYNQIRSSGPDRPLLTPIDVNKCHVEEIHC